MIALGEQQVTVVMMRASSRTLDNLVREDRPWRECAEVLLRASWGLAFAHRKGVIHRDVKPQNILLGNGGEVYLADWGLAALTGRGDPGESEIQVRRGSLQVDTTIREGVADRDTGAGMAIVGTPAFMPPEAALPDIERTGPWSDVWSLGASLFVVSTRSPLIDAKRPMAVLEALRSFRFDPGTLRRRNPGIPRSVVDLCAWCLQRDPGARPRNAEEFAQALQAALR